MIESTDQTIQRATLSLTKGADTLQFDVPDWTRWQPTSYPTRFMESVNRCMMLRSSIIAGRSASKGCWNLDAEHQRDALDVRICFSTPGALPVSSDVLPSIIEQIIHVLRRFSNSRSCRSSSGCTLTSRFRPSSIASLEHAQEINPNRKYAKNDYTWWLRRSKSRFDCPRSAE